MYVEALSSNQPPPGKDSKRPATDNAPSRIIAFPKKDFFFRAEVEIVDRPHCCLKKLKNCFF